MGLKRIFSHSISNITQTGLMFGLNPDKKAVIKTCNQLCELTIFLFISVLVKSNLFEFIHAFYLRIFPFTSPSL